MSTTKAEADAKLFGQVVRGGDWFAGLLVARSAERKAKGRPKNSVADGLSRLSIDTYSKIARMGDKTVSNYLDAWELAAEDGLVPYSDELSPGEDVDFDESLTPDLWVKYRSKVTKAKPPAPAVEPTPSPEPAPLPRPAPRPQDIDPDYQPVDPIVQVPIEDPVNIFEGVGAILSFGNHAETISKSLIAMVEIVQDSKSNGEDQTALWEATLRELESELDALKSVVQSKSLSIEDFINLD